jgi:microcompartment protein CcmK/EutM
VRHPRREHVEAFIIESPGALVLLVFGAVAEDVHEQEASALDAIVVSIRPGALTVIERGP